MAYVQTLTFIVLSLASLFTLSRAGDFSITKYGGKSGSDITQAVSSAWKEACAATGVNKVIVPGGEYSMEGVVLPGPCKGPITFQLDGTITAPSDPSKIKGDGWIAFQRIDSFTLIGKGTIDGQGNDAWTENSCKKTKSCPSLPTNMRLDFLTNSLVEGITSLNSKMFHFNVLGCKNITLSNLIITAPENSANTDGIHIGRSDGVTVFKPTIKTGDDCISLGDGSQNVHITGVTCGPGHGIAIGSLGKFQNEEPVNGVFVKDCTLTGTMYGVRVKTWPASPEGTASDLHFEGITMDKVGNPVFIDQTYCPWNQCKGSIPSKVKLSNLSFRDIKGTSSTKNVVTLICSSAYPCEKVMVADIGVTYNGNDGTAISNCSNVQPTISGDFPKGC